jgi:hypothetical protein
VDHREQARRPVQPPRLSQQLVARFGLTSPPAAETFTSSACESAFLHQALGGLPATRQKTPVFGHPVEVPVTITASISNSANHPDSAGVYQATA